MKKLFALLLASTLALGTLAGCGESKDSEKAPVEGTDASVVTFNLVSEPKTIDPTINQAVDGGHVINHTFEGLYREKAEGFVPGVAENFEITNNEDGTATYTFKLREDAKWSDGEPVTAKDFVFSWKRAVDPNTASAYSYIMAPIVNAVEITAGQKDPEELAVKAIDDTTLEVVLTQEIPYFQELTTFPTYAPLREDIVGDDTTGTWARDPETAISDGPYMVADYKLGDEIVLKKNPNYWDAENITIDEIDCKMVLEPNTILSSFRDGSLDISEQPPAGEIPQLVASGECQIEPYLGTYYYVINTKSDNEALKDVRVRQALSMAIDRTQIVENVSRGGQEPAMGFVCPTIVDSEGTEFREKAGNYYLQPTAQVEEAKKLLAEAGYPNGEGIGEIEILYNTLESHKAIAEAIMEMWKQIGITDVKLNNQEWQVFQSTRNNLEYADVARHGWIGDFHDPQTFLDMYLSGSVIGSNGYSSEEYDELVKAGMATVGPDRDEAFYKAEEILINDAHLIPIYYQTIPLLVNERVQGWFLTETGKMWLGNATIAE